MKRFINLLKQDTKILLRSGLQYAVIFVSVVYIILVNFVIPEKLELKSTELFFDNTEGKILEPVLLAEGINEDSIFSDYDGFIKALEKDGDSIGIQIEGTLDNAKFIIFSQGTESAKIVNLEEAVLKSVIENLRGTSGLPGYRIENLREESSPIPFNKNLVPVFLTFEVAALGFLLIAVMIFQEKTEGSIHAYRVSSAGTFTYILSKVAIFTLLALLYGVITTVATVGFNIDYLMVILLIALASIFMTLLGLLVSIFFNNISEFLIAVFGVLVVMQLPTVSYINPSFAPEFIKWMPTYTWLFGFREALFSTGKENYLFPYLIILIVEIGVLFTGCYFAVRKRLMRGGL